jgi:hypothetical protein
MTEKKTPVVMFPDIAPHQKAQIMSDMCYKTEKENVMRKYTDEEVSEKKQELAEKSIKIADIADEIKAVTEPLKAEKKITEAEAKDIRAKIRAKGETSYESVFFFDDQENNVMNAYDVQGKFLYSRPLTPGEKQRSIHTMDTKTGS